MIRRLGILTKICITIAPKFTHYSRKNSYHALNHFSLANMVGRTARTLPLAAVSGGRAHRGWQACVH